MTYIRDGLVIPGNPCKYEDPEELKKVVATYFEVTPQDCWTITGLALAVGSKQLFNDYITRPGYDYILEEAKLIIENGYELDLKKNGRAGSIFALKNFAWQDKVEMDVSSNGQKIIAINYIVPKEQENNLLETPKEDVA